MFWLCQQAMRCRFAPALAFGAWVQHSEHMVAASTSTPSVVRLLRWIREDGGILDESRAEVRQAAADPGPGKRGLFATAPVEEGCLLAWLPKSCLLTQHSYPEILQRARSLEWPTDLVQDGPQHSLVVSYASVVATLAIEARLGPRSAYSAYIETLPKDCPPNFAGAALEAWSWLRTSPVGDIALWLESARWGVEQLSAWLRLDSSEELWAFCTVMSRSFEHPEEGVALYPLLDLLNHGSSAHAERGIGVSPPALAEVGGGNHEDPSQCLRASWVSDRGPGIGVLAARSLAPGDEVAWSYGPRSNVELLVLYGFALPLAAAITPLAVGGLAPVAGSARWPGCEDVESTSGEEADHTVFLAGTITPAGLEDALRCFLLKRAMTITAPSMERSPWRRAADLAALRATTVACRRLGRHWAVALSAAPAATSSVLCDVLAAARGELRRCEDCARQSAATALGIERHLALRAAARR